MAQIKTEVENAQELINKNETRIEKLYREIKKLQKENSDVNKMLKEMEADALDYKRYINHYVNITRKNSGLSVYLYVKNITFSDDSYWFDGVQMSVNSDNYIRIMNIENCTYPLDECDVQIISKDEFLAIYDNYLNYTRNVIKNLDNSDNVMIDNLLMVK